MVIPAVGLQKAKAGRLDTLRLDRRFARRLLARRWTARVADSMAIPAAGLQKAKVGQLDVRRLAAHRPIAHLEA
jgi:hypothetical protein